MLSRKQFPLLFICIATMLLSACSKNFLIMKGDERYFVATNQKGLKKLLCDSGDMDAILKDAKLEKPLQEQLNSNICTEKMDREKTLDLLGSMTREQRENLKFAFEKHGYDVNIVIC